MNSFRNFLTENWDNQDNKKKKKLDALYVSCDERYTSEKDKFKEYEEKYGKDKVDKCCEKHNNRKREDFEKCLKGV